VTRQEHDASTVPPLLWAPSTALLPRSERPLDLFAVTRDWNAQGEMPLELQIGAVRPANRADRLPPGAWRVRIEVAADNASPSTAYLSFRFDGAWPGGVDDDESRIWAAIAVQAPSARPPVRPPRPELVSAEEMLADALEADAQDDRGVQACGRSKDAAALSR
jgi:hypothetical protein